MHDSRKSFTFVLVNNKNSEIVELIDKTVLETEILAKIKKYATFDTGGDERLEAMYGAVCKTLMDILGFMNTLDVVDPYAECIQYDSIKTGIQAHAETYSFNIESMLFNQLTVEQQKLWREEIEQACISGGEMGVELARDPRYKGNYQARNV